MDENGATLEVGFAIDTGSSFDELTRLGSLIDKATADAVTAFAKVEKATANTLDLSAATASMTTFGAAATREAQSAAQALAKVEKSGESLSRQLDRQTASFGKTSSEIRAMKVETAALAAEQQGLTELAERLRTQEANLYAQELAAVRAVRLEADAAAQDKQQAADAGAAAAAREATAIREAAQAYSLFEAAARRGLAAMKEVEAAERASNMEAQATSLREAAQAYQMFEARARAGAAAMKDADAAAAAEAREVAALRAALDPAGAAAATVAAQLDRLRDMQQRGVITAEELTKAEALLERQHNTGAGALALNSTQLLIAEGAAHRYFDSLAAGMSPGRAFLLQVGDIGSILSMDSGGVAGGLTKVRALINPLTIGLAAATVALLAGTAAWLSYSNAIDRMSALSQGAGAVIGATGAGLEQVAEAAANAGNISVSAARDLTAGYVQMGGIGTPVLTGLVSLTGEFAAATGTTAAEAQKTLGAAMQDPVKGAADLTARYGSLTQAQIEHIQQLVEQNNLYGAQQALLAGLAPQFDKAADHANILARAWHSITTSASDAWTAMGKAIDLALGGGSTLDRLNQAFHDRATYSQQTGGWGNTSFYDKEIADLQAQLAKEKTTDTSKASHAAGVAAMSTVDGITGDDSVSKLRTQLGQVNALLADNGKAAGLSADQLERARAAQSDLTHAVTTWIPAADKANQLAAIDAQVAAAKTPAQKQALAAQRAQVEMSGQLVGAAQAQGRAQSAGAKAYAEAQKSVDSAAASAAKTAAEHAATLAREAAAQDAQTANLYKLAAAYKVSDAAALLAEARVKAESKAIKDRGDVEAAVAREVRLVVAQRISDAAAATAAMVAQTAAQKQIDDQVTAGILPAARAADALRDMIALRPLETALAAAQQVGDVKGADAARAAISDMTVAQKASNDERARAQLIAENASNTDALAQLQLEATLIGATNAQRAVAIAQLEAEQHVRNLGQSGTDGGNAYIAGRIAQAQATTALQVANDNFNASLSKQADLLDAINQQAQAAAQGMSDAFGTVGASIGKAVAALTDYGAQQARIAEEKAAQVKAAGGDAARLADIDKLYATKSATVQMNAIGDVLDATKGLFKEHSAGYKAMEAAEKAYRVVQLALALKSALEEIGLIAGTTAAKVAAGATATAVDTATTAASVANSAVRATADGTAAIAKTAATVPFPGNIAAVATIAALLVGFGVAVLGHGGGSGALPATNTGTGTVLGDSTAKSDSIKNAIDQLKDVDTVVMTTSRDMLTSLKSIDSQIGGLASIIVRTGSLDSSTTGVTTGFQTNAIGSVLKATIPILGGALASLFGTKTKVVGNGIAADPEALGSILSSGFNGESYADVQKTKKFFGITTSKKVKTEYGDLDDSVNQQFGLILKSFDDAITAAAGPLGSSTNAITSRLDSFVVSIGKIDLSGLSGTEIQEKLENVFGAIGDNMAEAAIPGLEKYQQVGEGYLQTLVRVSSTVETVTNTLDKLGVSTAKLGIDADMGLSSQFDSLSDFTDAADSYFQSYYTQAEQAAAETAQLGKVFDSLGLAMPDTLAGFRQLVEAQDLTTTAGQSTYATLLQLAPAFADLETSLKGVKSAADIASEREDLQRQILEAQGDTAAIRALDLAKLDESNRGLQEQLYAIQDAKDAADAAATLAQAWSTVGESIKTEIDRIRGLTDTSTGGSFATLLSQFNAANVAARGGDQDAAKSLPALSQSLLTAAAAAATSRQELDRVQAQTAAQLEATYAAISGLAGGTSDISDTTASTVAATQASSSTTTAANDDLLSEVRALRAELTQMHADNNAGHATTGTNTGAIKRKLDDVTAASGGDAITIVSAAA